jgi:tetratricopeptide (TPR) repeat protein
VIDRLRTAAAGEGNLGRARAALVYALARAGDAAGAKAELDRLASLARPYPLLAPLREFLARGSSKTTSDPRGAPPPVAAALATASGRSAVGEDPRALLQQAADAENRGQLPRAAKLYEDALRSDARSSEALAGLGSVALKQGDYATARLQFGKALAINPNYVPAIVGQADALWAEGDRNAAVAKYKDLVDRFPESSGFPSYVKTRAAGSASGAAPVTATITSPSATPIPPRAQDPSQDAGAAPNHPPELTLPSNVPSDLPGSPP